MPKLILASTSPRRKELLEQVNIPFKTRKQEVDESKIVTLNPKEKVETLAHLKAINTPILSSDEVILSADTVVSFEGGIFEKPKNEEDAFRMLSTLSGKFHSVYSGVCIRSEKKQAIFIEKTDVEFWELTDDEIEDYIQSKDPFDKAGAYGIQTQGAMFVKQIVGDYFNVVGLPISKVVRELRSFAIYTK
ncbi:Maf family protein [Ornithinibacillus halophilus]|uniref:dTTP/UTP pyrophosphatase n=1 Tax=Ornithinibacillus halophilus TaxID=930117 RepID=A0A1M5M0R9_9BACI|nr:Maf family protein [Ornithinibacillus halophilus]SHG70519.1 septum formation protein [Ornithinibacillus halophilus]